jgi:hypothetical protein
VPSQIPARQRERAALTRPQRLPRLAGGRPDARSPVRRPLPELPSSSAQNGTCRDTIANGITLSVERQVTMDAIYVHKVPLKKLRTLIQTGVFAIPELQREFVWNARKACDLLDSIYRKYPIGTILIWKTDRKNEGQLRTKFHILPPFNPKNRYIYFLIDGQQRLSVLWHLLQGEGSKGPISVDKAIEFGKIYFDPYAGDGLSPFSYSTRLSHERTTRVVSVVDLLSAAWRSRVGQHGKRAMRKMEECRRRIFGYEALLEYCETGSRTEVRETFIRINSRGMPISSADRAFARASKLDLRSRVREAQSLLKYGFGKLQRTTILQIVALTLGSRDLGDRAIDTLISKLEAKETERARFERIWPKLKIALADAADYFVYDLGVPSFEFLPSEPMLIVLTLFFYYNDNARPSRAVQRRLKQWFWATAVGARYTGRGYRPTILSDVRFAEKLASSAKAQATIKVSVPIDNVIRTEYSRPGPLSNAFLCLLRLNRPRYLEDGSSIPLGQISNRGNHNDKHHIFPRGLLKRHGIGPERYNSLANICFLAARENQRVGQRAPKAYLLDVPRSASVRARALRSHFIPPLKPGKGILDRSVKRGFKQFLNERAWAVARAFEKESNMRLFERT